ncbi:DUF2860 domain-containing protein [Photobacterium sp. TY1-4]|uniref:DUF2860 domain-containing protein n=1 Tax=Photobacterium sp. TY1-4 TaxID=2899122 RepID=UPI0021C018BA|nr:DUF2860 domain-containing protein [Photobacterium sp. TY1-4]UXI02176.1 DUF2860 domain-containing protein [Photobacterium sp. TY1-4]
MVYKISYTLVILSLLYSDLSIAELAENKGISGEVSINTAYLSYKSNFNTEGNRVKSDDLNTAGSSDNQVTLTPLGNLQYTFGSGLNKQIFIGTSREDILVGDFALEVGYRQAFADGTVVSVAYLPSVESGETWADPYLTNAERKTTDTSGDTYRFTLSTIAGSGLSIDLAFATTEIKDEKSGADLSVAEQKLLDRNGSSFYISTEYQVDIDQTSAFVPSITYIAHDADGEVMAFSSYAGELTYYKALGHHFLAITMGYGVSDYDKANPLFNKTRSDDSYSLFAAYEYDSVFGLNHWSLMSFAGYSSSSSNIEFYDESGYMVSMGLNYKF